MNGRIERTDARFALALALNSEMNYQTVNEEKETERQRRIRRKIEGSLVILALLGYAWLIIWKAAQGL